MSVYIKKNNIKIRNGNTYIGTDILADATTQDRIEILEEKAEECIETIIESIPPDYTELSDKVDTLETNQGNLSNLSTHNKHDLVGAINELSVGGMVIDYELSDTSINPVQNKVIKTALDGKQADFSSLIVAANNGKVLGIQNGQLAAVDAGSLFSDLDNMQF